MKSELKAKFLNHLLSKKKEGGFTLIELLVVIIIIGILSAIALPSFLNQANKGKQSEAKTYVGTVVRTQQANYLEKSQFATDLTKLSKPIASETENYKYSTSGGTATTSLTLGTSKVGPLRSYAGTIFVETDTTTSETNTNAVLCESKAPRTTDLAAATSVTDCGADADLIK
jgi:type IV pilus assembly protein PilA